MFGQALPRNSFLQVHGGLEIPSNSDKGAREAYLRTALGFTHMADRGFGRSWSPQVELLLGTAVRRTVGVGSSFRSCRSASRRFNTWWLPAGVRVPLTAREERGPAVVTYLLWDWFDGPFTSVLEVADSRCPDLLHRRC